MARDKNPEKRYPLQRGEKLFKSTGSLYQDLITLETLLPRLANELSNPEVTLADAIDALDQVGLHGSATFFSNRDEVLSPRVGYMLDGLRHLARALREKAAQEQKQVR